ncbi:MAG: hypothetical protein GWP10_20870, partial [Nitrospiraceae bacterium]|nr:hypothetical protein [Nitrospiraceae bacterium]
MKIMVVQEPDMGSEKSAPESSFVERLSGKGHEVRVIDDWKTCIIIGTRPEIIKMSPVVRACER